MPAYIGVHGAEMAHSEEAYAIADRAWLITQACELMVKDRVRQARTINRKDGPKYYTVTRLMNEARAARDEARVWWNITHSWSGGE